MSQRVNCEQRTDRQPVVGQFCRENGRGDDIEPVPHQADDLSEPQVAEIPVCVDEVPVAYRPNLCRQKAAPMKKSARENIPLTRKSN